MITRLFSYLSISRETESFKAIHGAVESDIEFKGARLWILIFAIVLASVGLNINSTAVIIGAMLISPLMGPINGIGYSIATYDFPLMRRSLKHLAFAIAASLATSTLYFAVSPVSSAYSELLARTSPTIYDVLIALFGGLAGTMSLTTKLKGNVVPGVAIATALMPPLCTAGYGIGTGHFSFFFGAFYLFTINTVFIGLSTVIVSQFLKFPIRSDIEDAQKTRINRWITAVIIVTLVPSIYFGYVLVKKERFIENAGRFVRSVQLFRGDYLLRNDIDADKRQITLIYAGRSLTDESKTVLHKRAEEFGLGDVTLSFEQGISFADITGELSEKEKMQAQLRNLSLTLEESQRIRDSLQQRAYTGKPLLREIRAVFPDVTSCLFAEPYSFSAEDDESPRKLAYVVISAKEGLASNEREKVKAWLRERLQNDTLRVVFEQGGDLFR
ncbi:MAG: DUF389 domain-containing protein [Chlorobium sp.]|nr:DUF389 domain-containing protein [Chlorobium sp.]MCF8216648.1 DUF389 domain-containing protein [Chlorobium sp.]MCF8271518.1 DUF389 domain-containing protein [Chlorobium sp.]MCF8287890.1 DUF389 domain-containing protein [Chlorobium sp.]MCF8291464.1 DUF389 domain-containing protein [Chlorobium sp.]MCF8385559.1 DUF389 domain-containing protein [Chlorobium sp.]